MKICTRERLDSTPNRIAIVVEICVVKGKLPYGINYFPNSSLLKVSEYTLVSCQEPEGVGRKLIEDYFYHKISWDQLVEGILQVSRVNYEI